MRCVTWPKIAIVQAVTILDFMIVMPLGPQLMRSLNIGPAAFGVIVSSYTFAAGIAGVFAHVNHLNAFALIFALTLSSFMVFPYLSAYLVGNVGMSDSWLIVI